MKSIPILFLLLSTSSCAYAFRSTKQDVYFDTKPDGANVVMQGRDFGSTPVVISIDRKPDTQSFISFEKKNYHSRTIQLTREPNDGWAIWDIGSCVIPIMLCIPLVVDASTGAWIDYKDHVVVRMRKTQSK